MLSSLPCFYAFCWSAIPTSCYILMFYILLFLAADACLSWSLPSITERQVSPHRLPMQYWLKSRLSSNTPSTPTSLVPRPSPKSGKRVWCSERQFLSQWAVPYFVKNVIIAFLYLDLEFLTPQSIWTTTQLGFQKLETAAKSIGTAENRLRDKFSLFPIRFKYDRLCHAIIIRSSAIWLVISNPRSAPPHVTRNVAQNTRPSLHMREGLGTRLHTNSISNSEILSNNLHFVATWFVRMRTREEKNGVVKEAIVLQWAIRIASFDFKPGKSDGLVHCSVKNAAALCKNHRERVTKILN